MEMCANTPKKGRQDTKQYSTRLGFKGISFVVENKTTCMVVAKVVYPITGRHWGLSVTIFMFSCYR